MGDFYALFAYLLETQRLDPEIAQWLLQKIWVRVSVKAQSQSLKEEKRQMEGEIQSG